MIRFVAVRVADKNHLKPIQGLAEGRLSVGRWEGAELGGIFNAWEWAIPSAIALYVLKPAFDAFLKELGTSAGKAVVAALGDLIEYSKTTLKPRAFSAADLRVLASTPRKRDDVGKKLSLLSITISYGDDPSAGIVKLIFANDCDSRSIGRGLVELENGELLASAVAQQKLHPHITLVFTDEHWHLVQGPNLLRTAKDDGR